MPDPIGVLVAELRTASIAGKRVRTQEPAPQAEGYEGDALGPGHYKRFVVLSQLSIRRLARASVRQDIIGVRAYGATPQDAASLYSDIADELHLAGGRGSGGRWIYESIELSGGSPSKDPDTGQPYQSGVISLIATN